MSITYNHATYIRDALDGFTAQRTDFPVEVIVADDASTDATPEIIRDYAGRYPKLLRPILRSKNVGAQANLTDALSAARGDYIALCEGDDYWTDPLKLAKQVEYFDRHPETAVCFHPAQTIWEDRRTTDFRLPASYMRGNMSLEALLLVNFIQTATVMYRRLPSYDDIAPDVMPLDWYLHVRHAVYGDIAMLPETMAIYRRHPQGAWWDSRLNPPRFWLMQGRGHAAMIEAMLDLVQGDAAKEEILGEHADWFLSQIGKVPGAEGRALLLDVIKRHPKFVALAVEYRQTPWRRLKRGLSLEMSGWKTRLHDFARQYQSRTTMRRAWK